MSECFADSFVFFALLNPRDEHHSAVVQFMGSFREPLVTTAWILTELADGLSAVETRQTLISLEARLRADKRVTILPPTEDLFDRGFGLFSTRADKGWSLTDCISFVVMEERRIVDALTGDRHFEQAGFNALLK